MNAALGIAGFLAFTAFGIAQLVAGFVGIEQGLGLFWAWAALFAALIFRFTLPITIGAFFGAMNVWGWHWAWAALFAAPGLAFVIPGVISLVFSAAFSTMFPQRTITNQEQAIKAQWMPQWVWQRPMTHWVWAMMWLLGSSPLTLLPQIILICSAYPERRAWGRWAAVFATVSYGGMAWAWWLSDEEFAIFLAIVAAVFGALAWYGFWHERRLMARHGDGGRGCHDP